MMINDHPLWLEASRRHSEQRFARRLWWLGVFVKYGIPALLTAAALTLISPRR